jgi:hypothetical protein
MLPEEASEIVVWASEELSRRISGGRTQLDIYAEFKTKLIALQGEQGLAFNIPSFSAFNRLSLRQAELGRRLEETRQISTALAGRLDGIGNEDLTIMVIEGLKTLAFEIITDRGQAGATPKEVMEMSRAIQSLVATSKLSTAQRQAFEDELAEATDEVMDKVTAIAKEAGVSADRMAQIRRDFLGVRPKEKS